jgi:hypothetical protein
VILAVSLALMALLVATAGQTPHRSPGRNHALADAATSDARGARHGAPSTGTTHPRPDTGAPSTTTTTSPAPPIGGAPSGSLLAGHTLRTGTTVPSSVPASATTTTVSTTTTTVGQSPAVPADRTVTQGYLDPPLQTSNSYGFTGNGAMQISVEWSGTTYLTMAVTCPSGTQSVGGTAAMAASLPDASGSCRATVTEPASESAALTYTITIGPAGG